MAAPIAEPISPELVLVDPELARIARARLPLVPAAPARREPRPRDDAGDDLRSREAGVEREPAPRRPRRYRPAVAWVLVAAAVGLGLTGLSVFSGSKPTFEPAASGTDDRRPQPRAAKPRPTVPRIGSALAPRARRRGGAEQADAPPAALLRTAERKILKLLPRAPRGKVPAMLVDRRLGLVRSNVQVVCRRSGDASALSCVVRRARERRRQGLYLTYRARPGGRARIVWHGYRRPDTAERSNAEAPRRR